VIRLEHGQPVRFGTTAAAGPNTGAGAGAGAGQGADAIARYGLRFGKYGSLEPVPLAQAEPDSLLVHDAHAEDPSYAFALTRLDSSDFAHTPIGIFRQVERSTYDDGLAAQIETARQRQGDGDLAALLAGSDTWHVA